MLAAVCFRLGGLTFTWDPKKYQANVRKHGVAFEEAATTWMDASAIERFDEDHSEREDRWLRIGASLRGTLLVVWSAERPTKTAVLVRILGARKASAKEQRVYDQETRSEND